MTLRAEIGAAAGWRRRARRILFRVVFRAVSVHLPFEVLFSVRVLDAQSRKAPGSEPLFPLCGHPYTPPRSQAQRGTLRRVEDGGASRGAR